MAETAVSEPRQGCVKNDSEQRSSRLLLEQNQRLGDSVALALHHFERALEFDEAKGMRGQTRRIDTAMLDQAQQPLHAQPAAGTEACANGLLRHAYTPFHARNMQ